MTTETSERPQPTHIHFATCGHAHNLKELFPNEDWPKELWRTAYADFEHQRMRKQWQERRTSEQWLAREQELLAKQQWDTRHAFRGYALMCKHCGKTARQAEADGEPITCFQRTSLFPAK